MKSPGATAQRALAAEPVARFAHRADDVPGDGRRRAAGAHSTMRIQALVHRRAHQVVHRRVDDAEVACSAPGLR